MFPWSKSASPKLKRKELSEQSLQTLGIVESAEHDYETLVNEIEGIEHAARQADAPFLLLKDKVAKLYGDIDRFQQQRVDTISSSELKSAKEQVKARRKVLTNKLEVLEKRTHTLLAILSSGP